MTCPAFYTAKASSIDHSSVYEAMVSPRVAETIAQETETEILELHPIGAITEKERGDGVDYFDLMRQNLINLKKALE
jgi:zinc transport system substrate-binding protein